MSEKDKLEAMLEKSSSLYIREGDGWSVFCDGVEVKVTQLEGELVRAYAHTTVYVDETNKMALIALMNHIGGWVQKVGEYEINDDGEIVLFVDRAIDDHDSPDHMTAMIARYFNSNIESFRFVERGDSPSEVIKRNNGRDVGSLMSALRGGILD